MRAYKSDTPDAAAGRREESGWMDYLHSELGHKPGLLGKAPKNHDNDDHGDNSTKTKS